MKRSDNFRRIQVIEEKSNNLIATITDPSKLAKIASNTPHANICDSAIRKINDDNILLEIAKRCRYPRYFVITTTIFGSNATCRVYNSVPTVKTCHVCDGKGY
ncbi:MAG: hypothetical protein FWB80_14085 [Defluviitaleaceae bacterium]|nr:hypothetical protein [Defluviitaleaceae bacterium]